VLCSSKDKKSRAKQRKKHRVLACISLPTSSSSATEWNKIVSIGIRFTKLGLGLGLELGFVGF